jgi:hypothetical protein
MQSTFGIMISSYLCGSSFLVVDCTTKVETEDQKFAYKLPIDNRNY